MTAAETRQGTGISINVVYSRLAYTSWHMRKYFDAFDSLWDACLGLTEYRRYGTGQEIPRSHKPLRSGPRIPIPRPGNALLVVQRMRIGSPMEITFVVEGGGGLFAATAALLFARALRSPENIGSWLPRLVAAWHREWREAGDEKLARRTRREASHIDPSSIPEQPRPARELLDVGAEMRKLHMAPDEVVTVGLDEIPVDLGEPDIW
jgi:hypothetical protein